MLVDLQALALLEAFRARGDGRLATTLRGLDEALHGGIPAGKLTEVVGPSGIGKTQVSSSALCNDALWDLCVCDGYEPIIVSA